jgi:hypothetical protein
MLERNRAPLGSARPGARLTEALVVEIRERFAAGDSLPVLADEFNTTSGSISRIVNGLTWKHAGGPLTKGRRRRPIAPATKLVERPTNPVAGREQVAVGRSFAAAEREADRFTATAS